MQPITRRFEFDAMHRVLNHKSKCKHLHGHRYVADVTIVGTTLDDLSMVLDYAEIKNRIGTWIELNWDHNSILHPQDPLALIHLLDQHQCGYEILLDEDESEYIKKVTGEDRTVITADQIFGFGKHPYICPPNHNPTAETLAHLLFLQATEILSDLNHICVDRVRIYETPNCYAEFIR